MMIIKPTIIIRGFILALLTVILLLALENWFGKTGVIIGIGGIVFFAFIGMVWLLKQVSLSLTKMWQLDMQSMHNEDSAQSAHSINIGLEKLEQIQSDTTRDINTKIEFLNRKSKLNRDLGIHGDLPDGSPWGMELELISKIVDEIFLIRPDIIVEAGSGLSTIYFGYALKHQGFGRLICLEHDSIHGAQTIRYIKQHKLEAYVDIQISPLISHSLDGQKLDWYSLAGLEKINQISMLVIDGPPLTSCNNPRFGALHLLHSKLSNTVVFLDDGKREHEKQCVDQWQKQFSDISTEYLDTPKGAYKINIAQRESSSYKAPRQRVVFSKQSDIHYKIQKFWYAWYRNIFKADHIIITPVKTNKSRIEQTVNFYKDKPGVTIVPIHIEDWQPAYIWDQQLKIVKQLVNPNETLIVSADSDMFFEYLPEISTEKNYVVFKEHKICLDGWPSKDTLNSNQAYAAGGDYWVGFYNSFANEHVSLMGHPKNIKSCEEAHACFHLTQLGFDNFVTKVNAVEFNETLPENLSVHWRRWQSIQVKEGVVGLKSEYDRLNQQIRGHNNEVVLDRFLSLARPVLKII